MTEQVEFVNLRKNAQNTKELADDLIDKLVDLVRVEARTFIDSDMCFEIMKQMNDVRSMVHCAYESEFELGVRSP